MWCSSAEGTPQRVGSSCSTSGLSRPKTRRQPTCWKKIDCYAGIVARRYETWDTRTAEGAESETSGRCLVAGLFVILVLAMDTGISAQGVQTRELTGAVREGQGQVIPGVTVAIASPGRPDRRCAGPLARRDEGA